MCSTELWRDLFCCLWVALLVWWFHQIWPILLMPRPHSSAGQPRTPRPPKPGTPELCPACRARGESLSLGECRHILTRSAPRRWVEVKRRGGWPKEIDSSGRYCPNPRCKYFAIMDAAIQAIVADGHLGKDGSIQNWQCQACGGHASDHFGTFLYRVKKLETVMAQTLTSVSQGQGIRAAALWEEIAPGKVRMGAVQWDELHTLIKKRGHHLTELEAQVGEVGGAEVVGRASGATHP